MIYSVDVRVSAPVKPTEVADRVARAVTGLFPNADVTVGPDAVVAEGHDLEAFRERLFEQEILDAARSAFNEGRTEDGFAFELKKQAAFRGVVNFSVGNPAELGDVRVEVTVRDPDFEAFVSYLAPETEDGEPIDPDDLA